MLVANSGPDLRYRFNNQAYAMKEAIERRSATRVSQSGPYFAAFLDYCPTLGRTYRHRLASLSRFFAIGTQSPGGS